MKPCPYCGESVMISIVEVEADGRQLHQGACDECGARGPYILGGEGMPYVSPLYAIDESDSVDFWNHAPRNP